MRRFDVSCLTPVEDLAPEAIRAIRETAQMSQAIFARALNVTTSLVNVDLSNVLNDVAVKLNIDKSNIPINAQIPISIAANVCGVSINILSIGAGGGDNKGCAATTASPELVQAVQQQLAAKGNVGGGAQTNAGTPTSTVTSQPTTPQPTTTQPQPTQPNPSNPQ